MLRKLLIASGIGLALTAVLFAIISMIEPEYRPAPNIEVAREQAVVERGNYLANHVLGCIECHSQRDWTKYSGPSVEPLGAGGSCLTEKDGLPGYVCMSNITSDRASGLEMWTDGEIYRAIREGVNDRDRALFPIMPYKAFRSLSDTDTEAVVAYLRSLPAHENFVPRTELVFPFNVLLRFEPKALTEAVPTPGEDSYGEYLATVAGCLHCHTPVDRTDSPDPNQLFAGGHEFIGPWGRVVSSNLTPHDSGIKHLSRDDFVDMFKAFAAHSAKAIPAKHGENTVMPWLSYAGMTEQDLGAIYDYLSDLPPIANDIPGDRLTRLVLEQSKQADIQNESGKIPKPSKDLQNGDASAPEPIEEGGLDAEASDDTDDY